MSRAELAPDRGETVMPEATRWLGCGAVKVAAELERRLADCHRRLEHAEAEIKYLVTGEESP